MTIRHRRLPPDNRPVTDYTYRVDGRPTFARLPGALTSPECERELARLRLAAARVTYVTMR